MDNSGISFHKLCYFSAVKIVFMYKSSIYVKHICVRLGWFLLKTNSYKKHTIVKSNKKHLFTKKTIEQFNFIEK